MPQAKTQTLEISTAKLLGAALAVILTGNSGHIYTSFNPSLVRPDPFTGTQGKELKRLIEQNESHLRSHIDLGQNRMRDIAVTLAQHEIKINECLKRTSR